MMMTMYEMKKAIVSGFTKMYGFAPAMSKIVPMESSGEGNLLQWMAFCVGGIGYSYDGITLERNESYDLQ